MNDALYPYAEGDLLEQRHSYFYSAFRGPEFLDAWQASRRRAAVVAQEEGGATCTSETMESPRAEGEMADSQAGHRLEASPTGCLLATLLDAFTRGRPDVTDWSALDRLVHRFEVSKRIHDAYGADNKPIDSSAYHDLRLYVDFADVLACAARASARLSYLNALLKCMDTLSAYAARLPVSCRSRYAELVSVEAQLVRKLANSLEARGAC